jgi:hypothetical protein
VHTGTALMVASSLVCVAAAVTNDRYFPEARMSQKEAKARFFLNDYCADDSGQEVTRRCRLSLLTNSTLVYRVQM